MRKLLIKIGQKTIISYEKISTKKINKNYKNTQQYEIEDKTYEEIIKQNTKEKRKQNPKLIIVALIPLILLITINKTEIKLIIISILIFTYLIKKNLPKIKNEKRKKEIQQKFPYALRQMSTQLKAGIGLYDSMKTIANSNYGALSEEFNITLNEIQYGTNYTEAFKKLAERTKINTMEKLVSQIIRTLNNGGNLADTLNTLADENSYNIKIKYREYSEKLNAIMLLYMFIAVLFPVILFIMIIAATTVMGSIIKPELLMILYLFFFPLIIVFMIILIKRMEPTLG